MIRATLILLLATTPATAAPLVGVASVVDGDTLEIHGQRVRLDGVDAPESWQVSYKPAPTGDKPYRCCQEAALALADFIGRRTVHCTETSRDRYKRVVANCTLANQDIAGWLVERGHALDWPRYSKGRFAQQQRKAQAAKVGVWRGRFQLPWERRRNKNAEWMGNGL